LRGVAKPVFPSWGVFCTYCVRVFGQALQHTAIHQRPQQTICGRFGEATTNSNIIQAEAIPAQLEAFQYLACSDNRLGRISGTALGMVLFDFPNPAQFHRRSPHSDSCHSSQNFDRQNNSRHWRCTSQAAIQPISHEARSVLWTLACPRKWSARGGIS
jgi:hypothetical protein